MAGICRPEAGKTLRATEAWTDGRHAEDDKHVELDCELAVALANATEGAAKVTVLRITQTEPSHGFVEWRALVDGNRDIMLKDIKREFLTGPEKLDEIMEKLDIIVNDMVADDGPAPMDLGRYAGCEGDTE